jgi:CRP/FNR family transcriptional regulator
MSVDLKELARCPLFSTLPLADLARIAGAARTMRLPAGQMIFHEGQPCEGFYVVVAGSVRVFKIGPDGRERILHIVRSPHSFAEAAMFGQGVYPAFAAAIESSRLMLIRRDAFLNELRERPRLAFGVFESLSTWMRRLVDQLDDETFLNARARLANYLLRAARRQGTGAASPCRVHLTEAKKDVASQLGMVPETFSRALADLESRGLIRMSGRRIDLLDLDAVETLLLSRNA